MLGILTSLCPVAFDGRDIFRPVPMGLLILTSFRPDPVGGIAILGTGPGGLVILASPRSGL